MKIINWIFSSFFRTFGRFLFYILIGFLIMFLLNSKVDAAIEGNFWYDKNVQNVITSSQVLNWTSPTTYNAINTTSTRASNSIQGSMSYTDTVTVATNGVSFQIYLGDQLRVGYLYSIQFYLCTPSSVNFDYTYYQLSSGINPNNSARNTPAYYYGTYSRISPTYAEDMMVSMGTCGIITGLISPSENGSWYDVRMKNPSSISFQPFLMGYSIETLGLYSDILLGNIQRIINNSGLATASNIQEVNNAIDEVKVEMNNVNSSIEEQTQQQQQNHQETMDTITSTESADLDALENSAGWLPAGPVDSILNLPLSLLNNLTTNLNKSCQPVILPIPYVNRNLNLPCVNTLYADMGISGWVTTIGVIASAFIMFSYLIKLYKWVDDTLSFRENNYIDNWGGI